MVLKAFGKLRRKLDLQMVSYREDVQCCDFHEHYCTGDLHIPMLSVIDSSRRFDRKCRPRVVVSKEWMDWIEIDSISSSLFAAAVEGANPQTSCPPSLRCDSLPPRCVIRRICNCYRIPAILPYLVLPHPRRQAQVSSVEVQSSCDTPYFMFLFLLLNSIPTLRDGPYSYPKT